MRQIIPNIGIQINHYVFADDSAVWAGLLWAVILLVRESLMELLSSDSWTGYWLGALVLLYVATSTIRLNQASGQGSLMSSSKKVKAEVARLPEALLWTFHNTTAGTFY